MRPVKSPLTPREWEVLDLLAKAHDGRDRRTRCALDRDGPLAREEHPAQARRPLARGGGRSRGADARQPVAVARAGLLRRQREVEPVGVSRRAGHADGAAVPLHDPAHDRQAEAGAARAALGQAPLPRLEDALAVALGDCGPGALHDERPLLAGVFRGHANLAPVARTVFDGVGEQVAEDAR